MARPVKQRAAELHSAAAPRATKDASSVEVLASGCFNAPFGKLAIIASDAGIRSIGLSHVLPVNAAAHNELVDSCGGCRTRAKELVRLALQQLGEYFARQRTSFTLPLDARGTDFQLMAWAALCRIPFGSTSTYMQVT